MAELVVFGQCGPESRGPRFLGHLIGAVCPCRGGAHDRLSTGNERAERAAGGCGGLAAGRRQLPRPGSSGPEVRVTIGTAERLQLHAGLPCRSGERGLAERHRAQSVFPVARPRSTDARPRRSGGSKEAGSPDAHRDGRSADRVRPAPAVRWDRAGGIGAGRGTRAPGSRRHALRQRRLSHEGTPLVVLPARIAPRLPGARLPPAQPARAWRGLPPQRRVRSDS